MKRLHRAIIATAIFLTACGQPQQQDQEQQAPVAAPAEQETAPPPAMELQAVDAELLAAPNAAFTAIEPSEVGVFGAPTVMEALAPLLSPEVSEGATVRLTLRESGEDTVADVVRMGLVDDAVSAGHVRIEFRREPDGWYPTNAYRRAQCRRGALAGQWTTELCP